MKTTLMAMIAATGLVACTDGTPQNAEGWKVSDEQPAEEVPSPESESTPQLDREDDERPAERSDERFVVHEWGTFTSLQGSDGEVQSGMHYEEESLPAFVYGRVPPAPGMPPNKQVEETLLDGITQKLETPVIYFYGAPEHVDVTVDFPRGVVSQWYPDAASYSPDVYEAEFDPDNFLDGTMTWSLDVLPYGETAGLVEVPEEDVWSPSREVDAQPVRFGDEVEKFIFYRGVGRFDTPFRVTSSGDLLTLRNESGEDVPDVWVLSWNGENGSVKHLGALPAGGATEFMPTPKELPTEEYLDTARESLAAGLERTGLTRDEAWSMVNTWSRSYFETQGLRVLYTVPRKWTDELLPLKVTPEPDEVVRTLVGRIEVLTQNEERELLDTISAAPASPEEIGRFTEPRLQRLLELTDDPELRQRILLMIIDIRNGDLRR